MRQACGGRRGIRLPNFKRAHFLHPMSYYETDRALSDYLLFHYGTPEQLAPYDFSPSDAFHFPVRCVTECLDLALLPSEGRALDLGCAVGRSSFELAPHCPQSMAFHHPPLFSPPSSPCH